MRLRRSEQGDESADCAHKPYPKPRRDCNQGIFATAQHEAVVVVEPAYALALGGAHPRRVGRPAGDDGELQPVEGQAGAVGDSDTDRGLLGTQGLNESSLSLCRRGAHRACARGQASHRQSQDVGDHPPYASL